MTVRWGFRAVLLIEGVTFALYGIWREQAIAILCGGFALGAVYVLQVLSTDNSE